ncbi:uncharacterized protein LOC141901298 [Tubulanus polymorphus]|uniref:uncharacterized protein LOC141901298 n=1 Tax=Tubulanus polymorphus TaxID=672921 RepID=UPI003DA28D80
MMAPVMSHDKWSLDLSDTISPMAIGWLWYDKETCTPQKYHIESNWSGRKVKMIKTVKKYITDVNKVRTVPPLRCTNAPKWEVQSAHWLGQTKDEIINWYRMIMKYQSGKNK